MYLDMGEISLIRSQNVLNNAFSRSGLVYIDADAADKLSNVEVEEGDVLLNITGDSVARCCQVDPQVLPARVNQHVAIIRPLENILDPTYLRYFLVSAPMQNFMLGLAGAGATRNALTKGMIEDFDIPIPAVDVQKRIAHVLGCLDDKIELNRQINTTLESMAQALFKSWFVDFDPVIDNALAAGNPIPEPLQARAEKRAALLAAASAADTRSARATDNAHPTQTAPHTQPGTTAPATPLQPLPADLRALFPGSFVFNEEMGWVPEGWAVKQLAEFTEVISKGTTPSKTMMAGAGDENVVPFIKVRDIDDMGDIDHDGLDFIPESVHSGPLKRSRLREQDVLFSIAGTIGRVSIVPPDLDGSNCNQAVAFIRPKESGGASYISLLLRSDYVQNLVNSRVVQAVQANFSLTELSQIPVLGVGEKVHAAWLGQMDQWSSRLDVSRASSRSLSKIRDLLLPKLLSGQIRLPEAEMIAAETQ